MRLRNLTRPIAAAGAAGSALPWEVPYRTEPIATLERNGANLFYIEMSPSAATRLVGRRIIDPDATSTRDIDLSVLLNREAAVVRVPAGTGAAVSRAQLLAALDKAAPQPGDALVLVTGWGDRTAEGFTEEECVLGAPYLAADAVDHLVAALEELGSDLVLTDLPYIGVAGGEIARAQWTELQPWLRPSWPSPNAMAYARHYTKSSVERDWGSTLALLTTAWAVLGLARCGQLDTDRVVLNIAPFQVQDVGEVPCTVVAAPA